MQTNNHAAKPLLNISALHAMRKTPGVLSLAVNGNTADLLLYDVIGEDFSGDGVSAKSVVQQIGSLPQAVDKILVRVNSPGGDVFDGVAIYNALLGFKGTVNVQIDGLCASIASVIAMAGKKISIAETATLMIHNPWTLAMGDSNDMRKTADLLDKVRDNSMLPAYARSGKSKAEITAVMNEETWYSSAEAVRAGWVDTIRELPGSVEAKAKYDLSAFHNAPGNQSSAQDRSHSPSPQERSARAARIHLQRAEYLRLLSANASDSAIETLAQFA